MKKDIEKIRLSLRPPLIATLFVGQSPPSRDVFYYSDDTTLRQNVRKAFEDAFGPGGDFLTRFRDCGWYLDDLVLERSVDSQSGVSDDEREDICEAAVAGLADRIREYRPQAVVSVVRRNEPYVFKAARLADIPAEKLYGVPFPGGVGSSSCSKRRRRRSFTSCRNTKTTRCEILTTHGGGREPRPSPMPSASWRRWRQRPTPSALGGRLAACSTGTPSCIICPMKFTTKGSSLSGRTGHERQQVFVGIDANENVVMLPNMTEAIKRIDDLIALSPCAFVRLRVWEVPEPVRGSKHRFKYSLAFVIDDVCVPRYDNEAGKGDHRHVKARGKGAKLRDERYHFTDVDTLQADFWRDVGAAMEAMKWKP